MTTGKTDGKKLLVLRDSYFDSVTPYLQNDFSELHIMDLRYYKTQAMELVDELDPLARRAVQRRPRALVTPAPSH